ncbi:MAG: hypothetical protein GXO96_07075 [Nitrospirae bacterium]|nr:hypothetical protein [Candidatus Manganitrophaceae bacterium]
MFRFKTIAFFLSFLLFLVACTSNNATPPRPKSVPNDAMWIGGVDGGAWILLKKNQSDPEYIYRAEVYGDQAGNQWYIGRLEVIPNSQPSVPLGRAGAYGVWDGDRLLLEDGRVMRAIDSFDPFKEEG